MISCYIGQVGGKIVRILEKTYPDWLKAQPVLLRPRYLPFLDIMISLISDDSYFLFFNKTRFPNNPKLTNLISKAKILWVIGFVSEVLFTGVFILAVLTPLI